MFLIKYNQRSLVVLFFNVLEIYFVLHFEFNVVLLNAVLYNKYQWNVGECDTLHILWLSQLKVIKTRRDFEILKKCKIIAKFIVCLGLSHT